MANCVESQLPQYSILHNAHLKIKNQTEKKNNLKDSKGRADSVLVPHPFNALSIKLA